MKTDLFVSGRLCLFGEHSDWASSYRRMNADVAPGACIVTGIEQGIEAEAEACDQFEMSSEAPEIADIWKDFHCRMDEEELRKVAKSGSFFAYCAGVASYMLECYHVGGIRIRLKSMTLPIKSGLSSSAAICVLVARAFNQIYHLNLSTMGEMNIAYMGEIRTSSRCGRMDQACAFGVKPVRMDFDGEEASVRQINVKSELHWVFADLCAQKDTIRILQDLNKAYPFPSDERERLEHEALGQRNLDIVDRAVRLMNEGDVPALGALMTEAQQLFDTQVAPLCPEELTAPKLHAVLNDPQIAPLVYGGKGVGSQGDGSVQFLAKDAACQQQLVDYLKQQGMRAYPLTVKPRHSIRKAIIPVAGFGTRLYPETRMLKKDFFPIVDRDGMVKPVILILLEELLASGIEDVCIILGSEAERQQYRDFFETRLPEEHLRKLNPQAQAYEQKIMSMAQHLHFVYQTEKRGFGHAVSQAAKFAGNEPVLLLLGDTIYRSSIGKPCCLQFIEAYDRFCKPMVSIHETPLEMVSHYGILAGKWEDKADSVMEVEQFVEKPTAAYAEEHLAVKGNDGQQRYYSVFGQYVLTPEVFAQLAEDVKESDARGDGKEVELTAALEKVRQRIGLMAVRLKGEMFDMGLPQTYRSTIVGF